MDKGELYIPTLTQAELILIQPSLCPSTTASSPVAASSSNAAGFSVNVIWRSAVFRKQIDSTVQRGQPQSIGAPAQLSRRDWFTQTVGNLNARLYSNKNNAEQEFQLY